MNLSDFKIRNISRVIAHTIFAKTPTNESYAEYLEQPLIFTKSEKSILIQRLEVSMHNSKKTFKLDYEDFSERSFHKVLHENTPFTDKSFIDYSKEFAARLAEAHFRTKIPGGYCLLGEGELKNGKEFFFVIKAELQEVFSITGNNLELVSDVFLSPAKDFYKVAVFIKDGTDYVPFMFDDQFSLQKKDLTEYFYGRFLGLTTDRNDSLKSKNFFTDTKKFIDENVNNYRDRLSLINALRVLYREETSGTISPADFSERYFEKAIKKKYDDMIVQKHPISFTKDLSLIDDALDLKRITMPLSCNVKLIGDADSLSEVNVIENPKKKDLRRVITGINSGEIDTIVTLKVHD